MEARSAPTFSRPLRLALQCREPHQGLTFKQSFVHAIARHRQPPLREARVHRAADLDLVGSLEHECEVTDLLAMPPVKRNPFLDSVQGGTNDDRGIQGVRGD